MRLGETEIGHIGSEEPRHKGVLLLFAQGKGRLEVTSIQTAVFQFFASFQASAPVAIGTAGNAEHSGCLIRAGAKRHGLTDQFNGCQAILGADQLSFTPQIASAFFDKTNNAVVSAKALSLRSISFCSRRFCFSASLILALSFVACDLRVRSRECETAASSMLSSFNCLLKQRTSPRCRPTRRQYSPASALS